VPLKNRKITFDEDEDLEVITPEPKAAKKTTKIVFEEDEEAAEPSNNSTDFDDIPVTPSSKSKAKNPISFEED
jgi:hypothetical protein